MSVTVLLDFRTAWLSDWRTRLLDVTLHALVAFLVAGQWWYQALPDAMLAYLWTRGMMTDRFEPDWSLPLAAHRFLHLRGELRLAATAFLLLAAIPAPYLALQWLAHVSIDELTHGEAWR